MSQESPNLEKEKIVSDIVSELMSEEFNAVSMNESIGGNAGENKLAVNAFVEKRTGKIIKFGNLQDIPKDVRENPNFGQVTFWYNIGRFVVDKGNVQQTGPEYFVDVISDESVVAEEAMENLREATQKANRILYEMCKKRTVV